MEWAIYTDLSRNFDLKRACSEQWISIDLSVRVCVHVYVCACVRVRVLCKTLTATVSSHLGQTQRSEENNWK